MDKQYHENTDSDEEDDMPEIDDFDLKYLSSSSNSDEMSFSKAVKNWANKSIKFEEESPSSNKYQNSVHFTHFHPIGEKFKMIKLKSVPIKDTGIKID